MKPKPIVTCSRKFSRASACNRPRSIYQYSNMVPRLSGQNCKFFKFLLSVNSQRRLGYKENNTKYRSLTRKPRSHVRILIYRTWPIALSFDWTIDCYASSVNTDRDRHSSLDPSPLRRDSVLWIYGDSVSEQFFWGVRPRPLCTHVFKWCGHTYNWIYQLKGDYAR